jgi:ferritin
MLSKSLGAAMNEHLTKELYAAHLYLAMSAYFDANNLPGCAAWMRAQADEERTHGMKFYVYVYDRGGSVELMGLDKPPSDFRSALDAFQQAYEHERHVSEAINDLYAQALKEGDYASQVFLQWFIQEQVEEEKTSGTLVETLKMVGDSTASLLLFDRELGNRGAGS